MKLNPLAKFSILLLTAFLTCTANAQNNNSSEKNVKKSEIQEKDQPLKIKNRPRVELGDCSQSSGIVRIRVTFDKSAKITTVEMIASSGCDSFDNNAAKAARGIKFKPAVKNGEAVTVTKQIEYTFSKY